MPSSQALVRARAREQHDHEHGDQEDAEDGEGVGEVHPGRPQILTIFGERMPLVAFRVSTTTAAASTISR